MVATQIALLWPTFFLVVVIYAVWLAMVIRRFAYMKGNPPHVANFKTIGAQNAYFEPVEGPSNSLRNLFEMPVLYFALVPLLLISHHGNSVQIILAWLYVLLRAAHSAIHASNGPVKARFGTYALSCAILSAMWIGFAVDLALGR